MYSQRNLYSKFRFRVSLYEFEDIIRQVDSVDLVAPAPTGSFGVRSRIASRLASTFHTSINPGVARAKAARDYDLFVAIVQFPKDLLNIQYFEGWKKRCRTSVCCVNEVWIRDIANIPYYLWLLSQFDHVFVQLAGSVRPIQDVIKTPCSFLPTATDALLFCPYPDNPARVIDVYSIGRRAQVTHSALQRMAANDGMFYVYDTADGSQVTEAREHRALYASMAKRSRYFIVNPGKVNATDETGGQIEFGPRYFEGAASGTIMLGEIPDNPEFPRYFDWPDAVTHVPFGSDGIAAVVRELDKAPERLEQMRTTNVVQSLLHHDWAHRWETILDRVGLAPMPALLARKKQLDDLAATVACRNGVRSSV
jgi:glycosyl transferase family 1